MSAYFYSPSQNGFYTTSIHGKAIPSDAVGIDADEYSRLMGGLSSGMELSIDSGGRPTLLDPASSADRVPSVVTRAQGKAALIYAGKWLDVLSFVDSIEDQKTKALAEIALSDTTHWQRNSPFLSSVADALQLSSDDLDALFVAASKIEL